MNKSDKKKIESEIISAIHKILSAHNKSAVTGMTKSIKSAGKVLSKKFNKAIKNSKKAIKKKKPVKKARVNDKASKK